MAIDNAADDWAIGFSLNGNHGIDDAEVTRARARSILLENTHCNKLI